MPPTLRSVLTMVAVLPEPPLLVPEPAARRWIAVGTGPGGRRTAGPQARGSFRGFGVTYHVAVRTP